MSLDGTPLDSAAAPRRPVPSWCRPALVVAAVGFLVLHVLCALVFGDDGWLNEYGLPDALWDFFDLTATDPLLLAGLSDFVVLIVAAAAWGILTLPPERRREPKALAWLALALVFPGMAVLVYPLWIRPELLQAAG